MTAGVVRKVFNSSSTWSALSVHLNLSDFFQELEEGQAFLSELTDKVPKAAIMPVSFMTSFFLVGRFILWMASTLAGFASMPRWLTMEPGSLPDGTLKTHFFGLSFQQ
jgi:hypothetical protein